MEPQRQQQEGEARRQAAGFPKTRLEAGLVLGGLAAALIAVAVFGPRGADIPMPPLPEQPQATAAVDGLSPEGVKQRAEAFAKAGPLAFPAVPEKDIWKAIDVATQGDKKLWREVKGDVESGRFRLVMLTAWDDRAEDGDVITVITPAYSLPIALRSTPQTVAIPVSPGGTVWITGTQDGGGGITAAVTTTSGAVPLPALSVGQTIEVPIR